MKFTIWVSDSCNLGCDYCYVNKQNKLMSKEVARNVVLYIKNIITKADKEKIAIFFHGGEPLLNFSVIEYIVNEFKDVCNIEYFMTTNGTVITDNNLSFLSKIMKNGLSISIDGNEKIHDMSRFFLNGEGTYNIVCDAIKRVKLAGIQPRLRMTVTSKNVYSLSDNYIMLMKKFDSEVSYIPDYDDKNWDEFNINLLYIEEGKIFDYLKNMKNVNFNEFIKRYWYSNFRLRKKCDGGISSVHFDISGNLYPCMRAVGTEAFRIGDAKVGVDYFKLEKIKTPFNKNYGCNNCSINMRCDGGRCEILKKLYSDNGSNMSKAYCEIHKMKQLL